VRHEGVGQAGSRGGVRRLRSSLRGGRVKAGRGRGGGRRSKCLGCLDTSTSAGRIKP
jgi:hypothetical protein